jgi:hypothetical protein
MFDSMTHLRLHGRSTNSFNQILNLIQRVKLSTGLEKVHFIRNRKAETIFQKINMTQDI